VGGREIRLDPTDDLYVELREVGEEPWTVIFRWPFLAVQMSLAGVGWKLSGNKKALFFLEKTFPSIKKFYILDNYQYRKI
jgi:hypothetical protein